MFFFKKRKKKKVSDELRKSVREYYELNFAGDITDGKIASDDENVYETASLCESMPLPQHSETASGILHRSKSEEILSYSKRPNVPLPLSESVKTPQQSESYQQNNACEPAPMPPASAPGFRGKTQCPVCPSINAGRQKRSLADLPMQLDESFAKRLFRMIDERGMSDSEVYNRAGLDRRVFAKIRKNLDDYRPARETALALAIGLRLNLDETMDLLGAAGIRLSRSIPTDVIVMYFIENREYDIISVNILLDEYGLKPLTGAKDAVKAG